MRYKLAAIAAVILMFATLLAQVALADNGQTLGATDTERISREVLHQLRMNPYYNVFDNLEFRVDGNHVTLTGQVTNPVVKSDAEASVRRIEGVESVANNIEVLPPSPMDDHIRREVYRAVYGFGSLGMYSLGADPSIHFIVDKGRITLVGVVNSEMDKNIAGMRANTVPGVFSVKNDLQVVPSATAKQKNG